MFQPLSSRSGKWTGKCQTAYPFETPEFIYVFVRSALFIVVCMFLVLYEYVWCSVLFLFWDCGVCRFYPFVWSFGLIFILLAWHDMFIFSDIYTGKERDSYMFGSLEIICNALPEKKSNIHLLWIYQSTCLTNNPLSWQHKTRCDWS